MGGDFLSRLYRRAELRMADVIYVLKFPEDRRPGPWEWWQRVWLDRHAALLRWRAFLAARCRRPAGMPWWHRVRDRLEEALGRLR